jgi:catechol 2,3-dioxygenase-like lactoylglutathione lyase family enzyme
MSLHGLLSVTIGVPNVEETAAYYADFGWYLKDPAGNFSEYYSDMDCIIDDQLWTPEDLEGARGLFAWGPPPPPSFLHPDDLAAMMTGAHSAR